jgi:hypothetical protein
VVHDPSQQVERRQNRLLFLANALDSYRVGLAEVDDGIWSIYFGTVLLARFDERATISSADSQVPTHRVSPMYPV